MIVIRVELWSANSRLRTELARMIIANDGERTVENSRRGTYHGRTFKGRSTVQLNREQVAHEATVEDWPREAYHVWNLVRLMLERMGYTQGKST